MTAHTHTYPAHQMTELNGAQSIPPHEKQHVPTLPSAIERGLISVANQRHRNTGSISRKSEGTCPFFNKHVYFSWSSSLSFKVKKPLLD